MKIDKAFTWANCIVCGTEITNRHRNTHWLPLTKFNKYQGVHGKCMSDDKEFKADDSGRYQWSQAGKAT